MRAIEIIPREWGPQYHSTVLDFALTRRRADEIAFTAPANFLLILLTPQPRRRTQLGSDRPHYFDAPAGTIEVIPDGAEFHGRWEVSKENLLFSLERPALEDLVLREFDVGRVEMHPIQPGRIDETALQLSRLIHAEMGREGRSELYLQSLSTALAIHFLRQHSSLGSGAAAEVMRGGLALHVARNLADYIQANLSGDLSLATLADLAGLSYSHFLRAFRQTMGVSPHRYVMSLRVQRAEDLITRTNLPLKQIASDAGFANQSHMTTAMVRLLNLRPGEIRRSRGGHRLQQTAAERTERE